MTKILASIAFLLLLSGCENTPSESLARGYFERSLVEFYKNTPMNVIFFKKTNGIPRQTNYELLFEAIVEFPSGANHDCAPIAPQGVLWLDTRPCANKPYVARGDRKQFADRMYFIKTEQGWIHQKVFGAMY